MKLDTSGLQQTMDMFDKLDNASPQMLDDAVKAGINVVADEMRSQISILKTSDNFEGYEGKHYPSKKDVQGLLDSMGYTKTQTKSGGIMDAKVGFDGYNDVKTKKYPKGHANQMIANSINKGTSFLTAQPFFNRTKNKSQQSAIDEMQKSLDKSIKSVVK